MNKQDMEELLQLEKDFQQAIVKNDSEAVASFLSEDWIIIDGDGRVVDREKFLGVIKSGVLTHDAPSSVVPTAVFFGNGLLLTNGFAGDGWNIEIYFGRCGFKRG